MVEPNFFKESIGKLTNKPCSNTRSVGMGYRRDDGNT